MDNSNWSENIIIVDADYVDSVAFDLTVNFERMLERRIPQADLARWLDCVALDGGLRQGEHNIHAILIHDKQHLQLKNFVPGHYEHELNCMAFHDQLGEFTISALPVEDTLTTKDDFLIDTLQLVCQQKEVRRIMIVPDTTTIYNKVKQSISRMGEAVDDKRITVFTMQPMPGGAFSQEILGYSLMAALGIRSDEINPNQ